MKKIPTKNGFTLIEIIVSLAIFTIVAVVSIGALLRVLDANKKSITLKTTINNMNFALESISREVRVGNSYYCESVDSEINDNDLNNDNGCDENGDWIMAFYSSKSDSSGSCNLIYAYKYEAETLKKAQQTTCGDPINNGDFTQLISPDIKITSSIIKVDNTLQPRVFLFFKGYSGEREREKTTFALQTSISQRIK